MPSTAVVHEVLAYEDTRNPQWLIVVSLRVLPGDLSIAGVNNLTQYIAEATRVADDEKVLADGKRLSDFTHFSHSSEVSEESCYNPSSDGYENRWVLNVTFKCPLEGDRLAEWNRRKEVEKAKKAKEAERARKAKERQKAKMAKEAPRQLTRYTRQIGHLLKEHPELYDQFKIEVDHLMESMK